MDNLNIINQKKVLTSLEIMRGTLKRFSLYPFALIILLTCFLLFQKVWISIVAAICFVFLFVCYMAFEEFKNRKMKLLSQMPMIRQDPTFVMGNSGDIVISMGTTRDLFQEKEIRSIADIFGETQAEQILESVHRNADGENAPLEFFSKALDKWYHVQVKPSQEEKYYYTWLMDITHRKRLDLDLSAIRRFSQDVMNNIDELTRNNDVHERLAKLMFQEGFKGFYIARLTPDRDLTGIAFKNTDHGIVRSDRIVVNRKSPVAAFLSQKTSRPYYANKTSETSQDEFEEKYPFDPGIKAFMGFDITSFLNYHEGDTVIIAYNKSQGINEYDCMFIEPVANTARTVSYLMDLSVSKAKIINDLRIANETQQQLLPAEDPDIPGLDISGMSLYCDKIGGDYYDYIYPVNFNKNLFGIVIADVSGHGISAALTMTAVRALLRSRAGRSESLSKKLSFLNHYVCQSTAESGTFVTMMHLVIDIDKKCIHWSRAGHEPVICYNPLQDEFTELLGDGMVLGFDSSISYEENKIENISPGTILLLATDGIFEARNEHKEMLGKDTVKRLIRENAHLTANEIKSRLYAFVNQWMKGETIDDDLTLVVVKFE